SNVAGLNGRNQLAVADLDGDGSPEIVAVGTNGVLVLDHNGNQVASGPLAINFISCGGVAIADVDGVAPPEIVVSGAESNQAAAGAVFRYTKGNPNLTQLWTKSMTGG